MYVCMYVYMYVCMCMCMCMCMYVYVCVYVCVRIVFSCIDMDCIFLHCMVPTMIGFGYANYYATRN